MKNSVSFLQLFLVFSWFVFSCQPDSEPGLLEARQYLDEKYGNDPRQAMDIYLPAGRNSETTPLLIYIHGGAWIDGNKGEFLRFKPLLEQLFPNYAFATLNYRLYDFATGKNQFPAQEQDMIAAFRHIRDHLGEWNISNQIVISGASAGGHLALLHSYKNHDLSMRIKAVMAFFPPTDLFELYKFNNINALTLTAIMGGNPDQVPQKYFTSSPINYSGPKPPPTILFHGELDNVVPISQSLMLDFFLELNGGVPYRLIRVPNQGHGFTDETYAELLEEAKIFIEGL
jgi:acetyl esterase/lipase